jgi:hypothetical protein
VPQTPLAVEFILSGNHMCSFSLQGASLLNIVTWIIGTVWEVLALCLAGWFAIKHFRELRQLSTKPQSERTTRGCVAGDLLAALIKTHLLYFARSARNLYNYIIPLSSIHTTSFLIVASLNFAMLAPGLSVCQSVTVRASDHHPLFQ